MTIDNFTDDDLYKKISGYLRITGKGYLEKLVKKYRREILISMRKELKQQRSDSKRSRNTNDTILAVTIPIVVRHLSNNKTRNNYFNTVMQETKLRTLNSMPKENRLAQRFEQQWEEYIYSQFKTYVERKGESFIIANMHLYNTQPFSRRVIVDSIKKHLEAQRHENPSGSDETLLKNAIESTRKELFDVVGGFIQPEITKMKQPPAMKRSAGAPPSLYKKRACDVSMLARFNAYVNYLYSSPKKLLGVGSDFLRHAEALVRCNIRNTSYVVERMYDFFKDPEVSPRLKAGLFLSVAYFIAQYAGLKVYLKWRQSIEKQSPSLNFNALRNVGSQPTFLQ